MRTLQTFIGVLVFSTAVAAQAPAHLPALDRALPSRADYIYEQMLVFVDPAVAMDTARMMAPLWRLAGNPAFEQSQQFIFDRLAAAGLQPKYQEFANTGQGWEYVRGTLRLGGPSGEILLSKETDRVPLAINSFSTPPGGTTFDLLYVGEGTVLADYARHDVKGTVVMASGPIATVWRLAVLMHGAAGVISTETAHFTRPLENLDLLQWGNIPFDERLRSFGFKTSLNVQRRLEAAWAEGGARVHVDIETVFHRRPNRTLVAEIPGRARPQERVVLAAHVQEPGANDNASGCGTLLAAALAIQDGIRRGALAVPARTITFLWVDEIRGSEQWVKDDAERAKRVVAMLSLDMTGEDTAKTGGTFLIEKAPDPSALWDRPSDPHSEWGAGKVDPALVRGSFLNDLHLAVALRRARGTGWVVRTNPYEGGSDHTVFTRAGVPALLNWHFTDRYYHTNLDTIDKTSAAEMQHVAIVVGTTSYYLASAGSGDLADLTRLMETARDARMETERKNNATPEIIAAWRKWYVEAIASVDRLR